MNLIAHTTPRLHIANVGFLSTLWREPRLSGAASLFPDIDSVTFFISREGILPVSSGVHAPLGGWVLCGAHSGLAHGAIETGQALFFSLTGCGRSDDRAIRPLTSLPAGRFRNSTRSSMYAWVGHRLMGEWRPDRYVLGLAVAAEDFFSKASSYHSSAPCLWLHLLSYRLMCQRQGRRG